MYWEKKTEQNKQTKKKSRGQCCRAQQQEALDHVWVLEVTGKQEMWLFKTAEKKRFTWSQQDNKDIISSALLHVTAHKPFREKR